MIPTEASPDLTFTVTSALPVDDRWLPAQNVDPSQSPMPGRFGPYPALRIRGVGDAWFVSDEEIVFHLTHPDLAYHVEVALLGPILPYWLERRDVVTLHGSAAAIEDWSIGLVGPNGTGKTSFALNLMDAGHKLLTDDLLAVRIASPTALALPTFPQVRLWPEDAFGRLGSIEGLQKAHPDYGKLRVPLEVSGFSDAPTELVALYVRRRTKSHDLIEPIEGPSALFHLMLNGFVQPLMNVPGERENWIKRIGRLLHHVPLFAVAEAHEVVAASDFASMVLSHASQIANGPHRPIALN